MSIVKALLAVSVAAAAVAGVTGSSQAGPLPAHVAAMKAVAAIDTVQVRWGWGGGWRGGWGGGWRGGWGHGGWGYRGWGYRGWGLRAVAAGAVVGGAIASSTYYDSYPDYYGGGYAYEGCYPQAGYGYHGGYGYQGGYGSSPADYASPDY